MIGDAVLYAASRATSNAVESVSRRVTWAVIAAALLLCGLVSALVSTFWLVEPRIGAIYSAGAIALGCAVIGLVCLAVPGAIERIEQARKREASPVTVVNEEAKEAVDYFGALQVVGAAFLFGLGAARRLKR
jgi:hypothetical protein